MENSRMKIAFILDVFPAVSETFVINQIADLADCGVHVDIFAMKKGVSDSVSQRFTDYKMGEKAVYLEMPASIPERLKKAVPLIVEFLKHNPKALFNALNVFRYGRNAWSLKFLFWCAPFLGKGYDLIHCHYGKIGNRYLYIKDILERKEKLITTFYGFDVSSKARDKGEHYYDRLKQESELFFVMSENMKVRVVAQGFPAEKIRVLPISIIVDDYPFKERVIGENETAKLLTVGRFVEKKGFDDLLKAAQVLKEKSKRPFKINIVGGGQLEENLIKLRDELGVGDVIDFQGYMKMEDLIEYFLENHIYVQPSKTAADGDME